jgi:hypothetical protein
MLAAFFMFYIFLPTTKNLYPGEDEYTVFLGMFTGTLMIFTFLIKTLAYDKITKNYGIKVNLLLPPFLLGIFVILATLTGFFFGTSSGVTSYVLFFLFVALGRLFSVSLKNAIEIPSQKILYQSLDSSIRHKVQVALDGMVNEIATITAGILLFIMGLFDFFTIIHYAVFLVAIAVVWIFTALHVHYEYKNSLGAVLESHNASNKDLRYKANYKGFDSEIGDSRNLKRLKLNQKISHARHHQFFETLFNQNEISNLEEIADFVQKNKIYEVCEPLEKFISKCSNEIQRNIAHTLLANLQKEIDDANNEVRIRELVSSPYPEERMKAAKVIAHKKNTSLSHLIITLLRDYDPQVKLASIYAAAQLKDKSSRNIIIDLLQDEQYNAACYDALHIYSIDVLDQLEQLFYKSGLPITIQLQIVSLYADIGQRTVKFLVNKIEYSTHKIVTAAIKSLISIGYKPENESDKQKMMQLLRNEIHNLAWNLNITTQLTRKIHGETIISAFAAEKQSTLDRIYNILMLIYNRQSVEQVQKNLSIGTSESISYALELMDLFVDEEIKAILFIAFEDVSNNEKVRRYQDHFPLPKLDSVELLNDIINRDINYISRYTKACALEALAQIPESAVSDTTIAQIFNKDLMLKQEAVLTIVKGSEERFAEIIKRVDHHEKMLLNDLLKKSTKHSLYQIVSLVKNHEIFNDLNYNELTNIIENARVIELQAGETDILSDNELDAVVLLAGEVTLEINDLEKKPIKDLVVIDLHHENQRVTAIQPSTVLVLPHKKVLQFTNEFQQQEVVLSRII